MDQTAPLIYVVEDEAEIQAIFMELLTDAGYRVRGFATAQEVQQLISSEWPDLVLLDNHLELYAAGWALLTMLRTNPATATIPIILVSGDAQFLRMWSAGLHEQGCYILEKPFDLDDVLTTVYAALGVVPAELKVSSA
jgi:DNA-binding response OmpR family regulator